MKPDKIDFRAVPSLKAVIRALAEHGTMSCKGVADKSGLSYSTVVQRTMPLLVEWGIVKQDGRLKLKARSHPYVYRLIGSEKDLPPSLQPKKRRLTKRDQRMHQLAVSVPSKKRFKEIDRERLSRDVDAFLANGGKVETLPGPGEIPGPTPAEGRRY